MPNGTIAKYKTRLLVKGFLQKERVDFQEVFAPVDFQEVFAPVDKLETISLVTSIASFKGWFYPPIRSQICLLEWAIG